MATQQRRGGIIQIQIDGTLIEAAGAWTYKLSGVMRESLAGHDGLDQGWKELPVVGYIEGEIRDRSDLDVEKLQNATNVTVTLKLANGKMIRVKDGRAAGDWTGGTEEGVIAARFEGQVREVRP